MSITSTEYESIVARYDAAERHYDLDPTPAAEHMLSQAGWDLIAAERLIIDGMGIRNVEPAIEPLPVGLIEAFEHALWMAFSPIHEHF